MTVLWAVIGVLVAVVWVITLIDVVRSHLGTARTAAWALIVILLPLVGSLLYWVLRTPPQDEVDREVAREAAMRHGAERPPFDPTRLSS